MSRDLAAPLPQEALENILLRLPASDLRRFRRICKEWRDIISDPIFIKVHMVQRPMVPTHTIVFVPSSKQQTNNGFLFDERWQLTAKFTVGASEVMIGTCNGLLCFHDGQQKIIRIVEPFTGEAITLPEPTDPLQKYMGRSYCFGFDATARQYKIVHQVYNYNILKLFTVGVDKDWRTIMSIPYVSRSDLACNDGTVYWSYKDSLLNPMYACFDLATEQITSVMRCMANERAVFCNHPWWKGRHTYVMLIRWLASKSQDGYWPHDMNAMAFDTDCLYMAQGRHAPRGQALQRGHLLLQEANGAVYAHKIIKTTPDELKVGCQKLLIGSGPEEDPAKSLWSGQFVPVHGGRRSRTQQAVATASEDIRTFAYAPTVSPAPLALYLGTTMH